ncbi:MAG: hypothetical protein JWN50_637 [Parcubacteria group bacterium]|nr:hypothetical protein [Parcubacteria group bacterium]
MYGSYEPKPGNALPRDVIAGPDRLRFALSLLEPSLFGEDGAQNIDRYTPFTVYLLGGRDVVLFLEIFEIGSYKKGDARSFPFHFKALCSAQNDEGLKEFIDASFPATTTSVLKTEYEVATKSVDLFHCLEVYGEYWPDDHRGRIWIPDPTSEWTAKVLGPTRP